MSGWTIADAVSLTLPAGTVISPGSLFLVPTRQPSFNVISARPGESNDLCWDLIREIWQRKETIQYDELGVLHDSHTFSGRSPGFNGDSREDRDSDGLNALMEWALGFSG